MSAWDLSVPQAMEYKKRPIQELYAGIRLSSLMVRLLSLHSWSNLQFAFFNRLLQLSLSFRWGLKWHPANLVTACFQWVLLLCLGWTQIFSVMGFSTITYWVLLEFLLIFKCSHKSRGLFCEDCRYLNNLCGPWSVVQGKIVSEMC